MEHQGCVSCVYFSGMGTEKLLLRKRAKNWGVDSCLTRGYEAEGFFWLKLCLVTCLVTDAYTGVKWDSGSPFPLHCTLIFGIRTAVFSFKIGLCEYHILTHHATKCQNNSSFINSIYLHINIYFNESRIPFLPLGKMSRCPPKIFPQSSQRLQNN